MTIRPVRAISRKGPVPKPGSMQSRPTSVMTWRDSSTEKEASTFPIRRERDRGLPFRVSLSFNVSQVGPEAPQLLRSVFGVGTVRGRGDGVFYFEVTKPTELDERVFPFFERFPIRGPKAKDLAVFRQITELVQSGRHLSSRGIGEVLALRGPMNRGGKRRRTDDEIIEALRIWESSEAIRRAPSSKQRDEDMVHAP